MSSSIPSFFTAEMGTTGIPSSASSSLILIDPPFADSSSIMFKASTIGMLSSISCSVRYRLRSMFVASTMLMIAVGFSLMRKSRVTTSSLEYGESE